MSRGLSLDDKEKEFLTNISRMEGGKMVIDVSSISEEFGNVQQIALDELTDTQLTKLKQFQTQFKEMDTKDIAREQFTTTQNIGLNVSALVAMGRLRLGKETGKLGRTLDDVFGKDLEKGIRAQRDKIIGKSSDAEVQKAFGEKNSPTSTNVNPSSTPQQSVPLDNSKPTPSNSSNATNTETQSNKTEVTVNVKSDAVMDEWTRYIVKRPESIDAFLNGTNPRDYTSQ
jgi:hypothetical protein